MAREDGLRKDVLRRAALEFGTPCYVYFADQIRERVKRVREAFGNRFRISYAVKSNPNPALLSRMREFADLLDVSSSGEVERGLASGWEAEKLGFTGPAKTAHELRLALKQGIGEVVVESVDESRALEAICADTGRRQRILVRLAPRTVPRGFGVSMSGRPTQFGIDEEEMDSALAEIRDLAHLDLAGFHVYSGTQCLKADAVSENYDIFIDVFRRASRAAALSPRRLVFGSGLGIPHYETDVPLDLDAVAARTNPALDHLRREPAFAQTELVLETGRYLVGEAGVYLTRVIRTKRSRGAEIAICDGGMNHHLAATGHFGGVVPRNYRMFKVTEECGEEEAFTLVGPLCTTIDTLGRQVRFHGLRSGDLIGIECSGAYGATASPIHFISHDPPGEIIVDTVDGAPCLRGCGQFARVEGDEVQLP